MDTKNITIRKMEERDIKTIITIAKAISTPIHSEFSALQVEFQYYIKKTESICLVAELSEQIVGFMIGAIHPWLFGINNSGWIEILGVDPAHTGKGVGKMLGEELFVEFRERGIKIVHTAVDWMASDLLEFFRILGMTKSGLISLVKEL
jgi:ribosomal protein S18 acetylase RimI-like enzyme